MEEPLLTLGRRLGFLDADPKRVRFIAWSVWAMAVAGIWLVRAFGSHTSLWGRAISIVGIVMVAAGMTWGSVWLLTAGRRSRLRVSETGRSPR